MTARLSNLSLSQEPQSLEEVWQTIDFHSCPSHYNFHLHTVCSDGQLTPEELMEQACTLGLQGLAITDHHSINGYLRAIKWLERQQKRHPERILPYFWIGMEITADLFGTEVHLLGYGFDHTHRAMKPYLRGNRPSGRDAQAGQVISCLHQAGGLAVLAHPARYRRSAGEVISEAHQLGIDGVEAYYAYHNPNPWRPSIPQTEMVEQMALTYNLFTTCGTDTHGSNLLMRV